MEMMVINGKSIRILSYTIAFFSLGSFDSCERMAADGFERAKLPADRQGYDGTRGKACGRREDEVLGRSAPGLLETLHRSSITPQGRALRTLRCFARNEYQWTEQRRFLTGFKSYQHDELLKHYYGLHFLREHDRFKTCWK